MSDAGSGTDPSVMSYASTMTEKHTYPWAWVPTLYFAEGIPYAMVMIVAGIMYKRLDISNADIAYYTSLLNLPWVVKPLWSPLIDILGTKRLWIVMMQVLIGGALAMVAFTLPGPHFFQYTMAFFFLMAFSSATHDIAADGFYMLGLKQHQQAAFVGVRSTFYRFAIIGCQGLLVMFAGYLETYLGNVTFAWQIAMFVVAGAMLAMFVYHLFFLPAPAVDAWHRPGKSQALLSEYFKVFVEFFKKDQVITGIIFLLLFRFAEGQLAKIASLFLLDTRDVGGLEMSTELVGLIYGTFGVGALLAGGILGGLLISRHGLRYWLWPMVIMMNLPDLVYVFLAYTMPASKVVITAAVIIEQFGYGFGFTAYMLYMIMMAEGEHKTAHFAICTGFMALSLMLPGMISGWLEELLGYQYFFVWVMIATIPSFIVTALVKVDPEFGRKRATDS